MKACMLIPAHNEAPRVPEVIAGALAFGPVLVVDDGSTDATAEAARRAGAEVLSYAPNRGKGAALRAGFDWIFERGYDAAVCLDADGQHRTDEIPRFLEAGADADLVIGNRMADPAGMPWARRKTNQFTSWLLGRLAGGIRVPDTQCGFRLIRRDCWLGIDVRGENYEFEGESIVLAARAGFRVGSVPVTSVYEGETSGIRPVRDTVRFFRMTWRLWRAAPAPRTSDA